MNMTHEGDVQRTQSGSENAPLESGAVYVAGDA